MNMKPTCLETYEFDEPNCRCIKKPVSKISKATQKKQCPPEKILNPKTGRCIKKPVSKVSKATQKKENIVTIKSNTPILQQSVGNEIMKQYNLSPKDPKNTLNEKINTILTTFSPLINKQLVSKIKGKPKESIFGCPGVSKNVPYIFGTSIYDKPPQIMVNGKCYSYFSSKAQIALLNRLKYTNNNLKLNDVTAPKQIDSNCWFNSLFMGFFISNKGRKFFKFMRQLMIEGKKLNGTKIKPKLKNTLAWFNIAIELSLTPGTDLLNTFDTNEIIQGIYDSIPKSFKIKNGAIKQRGESGNPLEFYNSLISYFNYDTIPVNIKEINIFKIKDINGTIENTIYQHINKDELPDIIMVSLMDYISNNYYFDKTELIVPGNKNIKYKLDCAVVRDSQKKHFCALLEIDNDECGFDGVSFRKLSKFKWKKFLGKNTSWTFEGSNWTGTSDSILWNFRSGYYMLYYYRV